VNLHRHAPQDSGRSAVVSVLALTAVLALAAPAVAQPPQPAGEALPGEPTTRLPLASYRPFLEVSYGPAKPRFEGLAEDFATLGVLELKLGYAGRDSTTPRVVTMEDFYGFGSVFTGDLRPSGSAEAGEVPAELGRFGFGDRRGYGYGGRGLDIDFYNQNALNWTSVEAVDAAGNSPEAQAVFDRYGDSYRFGALFEAGVKIHLGRKVVVSTGLEGALVYPRHVFWPWLGSAILYSGAQGSLDHFGAQIVGSSPTLGPLLHFVLKSGVSLGYYLLAREDMNWPFTSETPLTVESFKLGAALRF
jgi:hypothetical protein